MHGLLQGDVVICSPQIAWLFKAPAADVLQSVAATGQGVAFYPSGLPLSRFRYDPRIGSARFVVEDDFMPAIAEQVPAVAGVLKQAETWPVVVRNGEYVVYRRP